jgi:Tfp pilus assembly protein PilF
LNELTTLEILPPKSTSNKATIDLKSGALYFFTRDKPREFLLQTPYAIGASRGTEFLTMVEPTGRTLLMVFDGEVELSNSFASIVVSNGEQATVQAGQPPVKTPALQATNVVQWWLYYPGVLDANELALSPAERTVLAASLQAYGTGDLRGALETYPSGRAPQTDSERIYYAGLLLSVGQVDKAEAALAGITNQTPPARALQEVIAVVDSRSLPSRPAPTTATEWLAWSYVEQTTNLAAALSCARAAIEKSPNFGFAWERVAELEFSFGHTGLAKDALDKALQLSPRNAQALVLRGFISAAGNHFSAAQDSFEEAIRTDPALGNGWLGRGLCRIHGGDSDGGRADLQTAAALEPNRSLLRSYLGKAFANLYDERHAGKELALASRLDPNDPTPWLYSALLKEQENRLNQGVEDLEKSKELNDNRHVYRSQLLLDQDLAVRSASLATIYDRDGMEQVAYQEAVRGVNYDYANYSAHLFLANSLDALRDPTRFNLRYETPWLNELLLANLLSPPGASALSQNISQQEFSKLFQANGLGLAADSSWRSDGQYAVVGSQYGSFGGTSYTIDAEYRHNDPTRKDRKNNNLSVADGTATIKQQLSLHDSVLFQAALVDFHSGDNFQYYNPQLSERTNYSAEQHQLPSLVAGYHREWSPGIHTLVLGTHLESEQHVTDKAAPVFFITPGSVNGLNPGTNQLTALPFDIDYHNHVNIDGAELNQIFQTEHQLLVVGGRYQGGEIQAHDTLNINPTNAQPFFGRFHDSGEGVERITGYGYYTAELPTHLRLTGGIAYDQITYPQNFDTVPLTSGDATRHQWGPKAGLLWSLLPEATLRAAYAKSLGGISIDQSYRLEPTQLAGFDQSFRDLIPGGSVSAPTVKMTGAAIDLRFSTRTYLSFQAEKLQSEADETVGTYAAFLPASGPIVFPSVPTVEHLNYDEKSLTATFNQLLGEDWSIGAAYNFTRSSMQIRFPGIPPPALLTAVPDTDVRADLHQVTPFLLFNDRSGLFARVEAPWYSQSNSGYHTPLPGDNFYQVNLFAGYRFPRQYGDFTVGLLNLIGTDYHLNPLNYYAELPRERVLWLQLRLNF